MERIFIDNFSQEWAETGSAIEKSELEIKYDRLSKSLNDVKTRERLDYITTHEDTKNLRVELEDKEPAFAVVINDLIKRLTTQYHQEEEQTNAS